MLQILSERKPGWQNSVGVGASVGWSIWLFIGWF
jgi:hypothetical protein